MIVFFFCGSLSSSLFLFDIFYSNSYHPINSLSLRPIFSIEHTQIRRQNKNAHVQQFLFSFVSSLCLFSNASLSLFCSPLFFAKRLYTVYSARTKQMYTQTHTLTYTQTCIHIIADFNTTRDTPYTYIQIHTIARTYYVGSESPHVDNHAQSRIQ